MSDCSLLRWSNPLYFFLGEKMKKIEYIKRETGKWECIISDDTWQSDIYPMASLWDKMADAIFEAAKERHNEKGDKKNESEQK